VEYINGILGRVSESFGELVLLAVAFLATLAGVRTFRSFAIKSRIVANQNYRNLHQGAKPRGGGIVFSVVFLIAVTGLWLGQVVDTMVFQTVVLGGAVAASFGFIDDVFEIGAKTKLAVQCGLAAWVLFSFGGKPLLSLPWTPAFLDLAISWFALVWLMNLYNFMDGIDGMAASGAAFICTASIVSLLLTGGDNSLILVFGLLAACSVGFLMFNWPPASIFMGDSGSLFLGYCFGALMMKTVIGGQISLWTWVIIFGYFAGDTTTTTVLRIFLVKRWYGAHRSNAYQNLARTWGSHLRVVRGVTLYHLLWLFPLAILSVLMPAAIPLAVALALTPVVFWAFRYGPRLSSS
jgi:Fuc2NAc and GlcNAc transferase